MNQRQDTASDASSSPSAPSAAGQSGAVAQPKARRYRGHTPEERRAQRRRRLLDAALELFGTEGYQNTSVERICSTSGVTGRHFYEEFASREALLSAVVDEIMTGCLERVMVAVQEATPRLEERVRAGVGAYIHQLAEDPRRARIVSLEIVGVSAEFEQHRRELGTWFADYLRAQAIELMEAGEPLAGDQLTLQALLAVIHELTILYLSSREPLDIQDVIDEVVRVVIAVVRSPAR